nr:nitrogenase [Clostridia bacterium]
GVDLDMIYATLRSRFPDIDFTDCYMNPIMRKSGLTPDQLMRSRLYMLLHEREKNPDAVAIIGNDLPTDEDSDLTRMLKGAGLKVHEITSCKNYAEYQEMAESCVYVSYNPDAAPGGDMLSERLGGAHYALKFSFDYDEIDETFAGLAGTLEKATGRTGLAMSPGEIIAKRAECERELEKTKKLIGDTPVSIDYTFCPRPLGLAKLLLDHGINVTRVYVDGIPGGDRAAFDHLKKDHPDLMIYPTVHPGMRFARTANEEADSGVKVLAIGQKAAAFDNTDHFVNTVEGGGMIGYEAITRTCALIRDAYLNKKAMRELVQIKGLGCEVCIR